MHAERPSRPITRGDILSADQVAELVMVHRRTVHRWALEGQIPSRKRGRRVFFLRWEIEAWLLDGARGQSEAP
ncbi:MAG: helix-turn-helix domain-containing protein [Beijerinckiaceae bacterium]|nr:helix-turn-helix domain-containing protein [Beijerinckiaceae bacterium]